MSEPIIRLSRPTDINNVVSLDSKCYVYPLKLKDWEELLSTSGREGAPRVVMLEILEKPVGFAMWTHRKEEKVTEVIRLGIVERYRRQGLGSLLMKGCYKSSSAAWMDKMSIIVPDLHCHPGDPDDVSFFLAVMEFQATGEIRKGFKEMYGDLVDGYVFERKVTV